MINKRTIIVSVIILILLIIGVILVIQDNKEEKTIQLYKNAQSSNAYTFSIEEIASDTNYKMVTSVKGDETSIDMYTEDEHMTTLYKEGTTYFVMHDKEEYYVYESEEESEIVLLNTLKELEGKECIKGKEEVEGKQYKYEEYQGISSFLMIAADSELQQEKIKTRFYYEGNKIVYIKTIVEGEFEELLKVEYKQSVDDEAFEIPENYAEV